jgi:hypothetical protein
MRVSPGKETAASDGIGNYHTPVMIPISIASMLLAKLGFVQARLLNVVAVGMGIASRPLASALPNSRRLGISVVSLDGVFAAVDADLI